MNKEFKELNFGIGDYWTHILLTFICLLLLPSVLIRNVNRIKVIMIELLIHLDCWSIHYDIQCVDNIGSNDLLCNRLY